MKIENFTEDFVKNIESSDLIKDINNNEIIDAKNLPFEEKARFLKWCLTYESLKNSSVLANVILLVLGGSLDDNVFEREDVYFNSITEYLDIKYEMKNEIKTFTNTLAMCFVGALKSIGVFFDSEKDHMKNIYWNILNAATLQQIGKILNNSDFNVSEAPLCLNADVIINNLCSKNEIANSLVKLFNKE